MENKRVYLRDGAGRVGPRRSAQEPRAGGVAAVDGARQFVEEDGHGAAHVEVRAGDGEQRAAALRPETRERVEQLQVLVKYTTSQSATNKNGVTRFNNLFLGVHLAVLREPNYSETRVSTVSPNLGNFDQVSTGMNGVPRNSSSRF